MTTNPAETWATFAVHGKILTAAAKVSCALEWAGRRDDLARPYVVMTHPDVPVEAFARADVAELRQEPFVPRGDFRFLKVQP